MAENCPTPEELAELSGDDPRLAHTRDCPHCQAVLASLNAFLEPGEVPPEADLPDAQAKLDAALDREMSTKVIRPAAGTWTPFRVRALAAVAAVVLVAVALSLMTTGPDAPQEARQEAPLLRGEEPSDGPFRCEVTGLADGGIRLAWPAVPGAVNYQVAVFDEGLAELARISVGGATEIEMEPPPGTAVVRVSALGGGDVIAISEPAYLPGP